ncbi:MAG: RsmG family class I SAM-dependent methyltransferase [Myxococcota bacterium]|jgi:16S rRNA (guanine527-N7)-methyltransferase
MFHVKRDEFTRFFHETIGDQLVEDTVEKLWVHCATLQEWAPTFNLVGVQNGVELLESIYWDSVKTSILLATSLSHCREIHDVGSGAGFPGLILPLFLDSAAHITLHEPRRKRASFLKTTSREMSLSNVTVEQDRVIPGAFSCDAVTSRATLSPVAWLKLAFSLVSAEGLIVVYGTDRSITDNDCIPQGLTCVQTHCYTLPYSRRARSVSLFKRMPVPCSVV